MSILEAMHDPALFGPWFKDRASWRAWEVFFAALFGLPLDGEDAAALFSKHTGRTAAASTPAREGWVIVGRRGGKSRIAALVAVYLPLLKQRGVELRRAGVKFHDLTMVFKDVQEAVYSDNCCHLTGPGYQMVACVVGDIIGRDCAGSPEVGAPHSAARESDPP